MNSSFGRWLRQRRRFLDLTQEELAGRVGCSPVTVRKLESDERRASKQLAERLAHSLAIAPAEHESFMAYARAASPSGSLDGSTREATVELTLAVAELLSVAEPPSAGVQDASTTPLLTPTCTCQLDWGDAPDANLFFGRGEELAQLRDWLLLDQCRLVAILGIGGIGKTSLAIEVARTLCDYFEVVIWRSLRTTPPVEEIMDELLHTLLPDVPLESVPKVDRQIKGLLEQLRQRRCLVILDNVEAILAEGEEAGTYRPGYAGYGELLRRVAESSHQSCLLITSRESPAEFSAHRGASNGLLPKNGPENGPPEHNPANSRFRPVRALYLASLSADDSRTLLAHKGLSGHADSWTALTNAYSGNPLLLQAVSETIRELFQGSIDHFLQVETTLFSNVRQLLAGQFARLAPLERDLLIWLALHCGPVAPAMLRQEMEPQPSWAALLDALHSLRRRSLVEQGERGFMLQNVVMEFVTDYLVEQIVQEVAGDSGQPSAHLQRYALLNTQEREYVRESQRRLFLNPIVRLLLARFGKAGVEKRLAARLTDLRQQLAHQQLAPQASYGAGNILNLLVLVNGHLRGQDFSGLVVRQASLQGINAQDANFSAAHLEQCDFSIAFRGVHAVAFTPAGDYFIIGSGTGIYCLRRWQEEYPLHRQMEPSFNVWDARFSPDGKLVAAAGNDRAIWLWATESGRALHSLLGHVGTIRSLCFSPDGTLLASGGADCSVRIWDVQSGRCLATLLGHTNGVIGLRFSPDGDFLASASEDGTLRLWATQGVRPGILPELPAPVPCVGLLAAQSGGLWSVAYSPDGALLAAAGNDNSIYLWDAHSRQPIAILRGHSHYVTSICFHPGGSLLASGSYDTTLRIWEISTGRCVRILQGHSERIWSIAFSADGNVLASGGVDQSVRLWDLNSALEGGHCLKTLRGYSSSLRSVAFSPDDSLLASCGQDGLVALWEMSAGQSLATLTGHTSNMWNVQFSPDGKLLASAGHDSIIRLWEVAGRRLVHEIEQAGGCDAICFDASGRLLVTANLDHTLSVWRVHDWHLLATLVGHPGEVWAVAFSPDGTLVASGSMDTSVRLWDWRTGSTLATLSGHTSYVRAVAFSPDGRVLASCGYDSTVRLWGISHSGAHSRAWAHPISTIPAPGDAAQLYVAFSPDGTLLASAGVDGFIHLWDVRSILQRRVDGSVDGTGGINAAPALSLGALEGHNGKVYSLSFRHDGRQLASCGEDGTIRLWDLGELQQGARQVLTPEVPCVQLLRVERPYARMNIAAVTGLTQAQISSLQTLGALEVGASVVT